MTEEFAAFRDAFKAETLTEDGEEHVMARADYTTNTLRVHEAADDPIGMTLIHALVSREEFMHGEWSVGLVNSLSRLKLASIDALYDALDDPTVRADRLRTLYDAWLTAQTVEAAVEPFQEAVDKLQILSVVYDDAEFPAKIQSTFDAVYGDEHDADEIHDRLLSEIETQTAIARGAVHAESDGALYVNPLYYHALSHATGTDSDDAAASDAQRELNRLSQRRSVAETVAQVTLDVPYPIAPLGPDADFDALCVEGLDVDPIDPGALEDRYRVADEDIDEYLLAHADAIEDDDVQAALGTDVDAYADTWLDHVFVSTLQALEALDDEIDERVHELDADDLRQRLSERVHGVDIDAAETMLDRPTPLLEVPAAATTDVPDQDLIGVEKEPLPKVLIEAFEQHGSFGAVVFQPTSDETKRQLNYHAVDTDDLVDHPGVPDGVDSYQALWEHYFVGKELLNTLFIRRHEYEDRVREAFRDGFPDKYALEAALDSVDYDAVETPDAAEDPTAALGPDSGLAAKNLDGLDDSFREGLAEQDIGGSDDGETNGEGTADDPDAAARMNAVLDAYSLDELRTAAAQLDEVEPIPIDADAFDDVECPLCAIIADPCGGDACVTADVRASYDAHLPALLDEYLRLERAGHQ
ncbi:hypothetical protein [Halorubellus litoreus]|uniref:Uncharacterized protein n=1 Tax=Halorubellus litoreus TaxID=755308 RepID=A0ABD5VK66_9EURY